MRLKTVQIKCKKRNVKVSSLTAEKRRKLVNKSFLRSLVRLVSSHELEMNWK